MIPKRPLAAATLALIAAASPLAAATRSPKETWGKAGVPFDQYRSDAVACAKQGYYLDIADTDDAKAFVRGSRELDDVTQSGTAVPPGADAVDAAVQTANQYERIRLSVQPERRIGHLKTVLQSAVDACLQRRGYVKFALTADQRRRLCKLPIGSPQRRAYLYELASKPPGAAPAP